MLWNVTRVVIVAVIVVAVAEISKKSPRFGALLLSLPTVSILAFLFSWFQYHDLPAISKLARETLILVILRLPFFVPFVFYNSLGLRFWSSLGLGYRPCFNDHRRLAAAWSRRVTHHG